MNKINTTAKTAFVGCLMSAVLVLLLIPSYEYIIFTSIGFFSLAIVLFPYVAKRKHSTLSTWTFFSLSVVLGCFFRGLYAGFGYPDYRHLDYYYFLGETGDYFILPAVLFLIALSLIAASYVYWPIKQGKSYLSKLNGRIDRRKLYLFAIVSLLVSTIAVVFYVQLTGGFSALSVSQKRSTIESLIIAKEHRTWQSLRVFSSLAMLAHLFVLQDILSTRGNMGPRVFLAVALFLCAVFIPFYSSTRSDVVVYLIFSFLVIYAFGRRVPWGKAIVFFLLALTLFQVMSVFRSNSDLTVSAIIDGLLDVRVFDSLVLNRNGAELGKTAHIIDAVPEVLDLQYGKTIAVWLVAPIPREIWNTKPLISSGPIIGTTIYGNRISGVPPGFIGEMFWNFHIFGVLIGSVFLGWMMKLIDLRFRPTRESVAVFIFGPLQFGHFVIGVSLGYGLVNAAINTAIAVFVFKAISNKQR